MQPCHACGKRLNPGVQFCPWCGVEVSTDAQPVQPNQFPTLLREKLDGSLQVFAKILGDLEDGRIGQTEFRTRALDAGVVRWENHLWILDLQGGKWWCYDGLRLNPAVGAPTL